MFGFLRLSIVTVLICCCSFLQGGLYSYFFPYTNPVDALKGNDYEATQKLLEEGANVEEEDWLGNTLLIIAIDQDRHEFVQLLLEKGANPNSKGSRVYQALPLINAVKSNREGIVELLLDHGADPNLGKEKPLEVAIKQGASQKIIQLLIDHKADTQNAFKNAQTPEMISCLISCGLTPDDYEDELCAQLIDAVRNGKEEIVEVLLENGVDPNVKGVKNVYEKPLEIALNKNRSFRIMELLVDHGASIDGMLHFARTPAIAEYLLMKGGKVDEYNSNGLTPLMCVNTKVGEFLIHQGAELEKKSSAGATALALAASRGETEKCRLLLANNAKLESKDDQGLTPLSRAVDQKRLEVVKLLIERDANIQTTDHSGMTPLMHSAVRGNIAITSYLLEKGANPNCKTTKDVWYQEKQYAYQLYPKQIHIPKESTAASIAEIFSNIAIKELIQEKL